MRITLMGENGSGGTPSTSDLEGWATMPSNDQTFPILSDGGWSICSRWEQDGGIPTYSLIGRDMTYWTIDGNPSSSTINSALAESPIN